MESLKRFGKLAVCIVVSLAAGAVGSLATVPNIPTWYESLEKPPLLPPNEVFGPVWSILYVMMGVALFLVWIAPEARKTHAYAAFFVQLVLNTLWSFVFFAAHLPWLGFGVIMLLLGTIVWMLREFSQISKPAMWLLVPYLAWVLFATYLTVGVAILN